jgi:predicted GH43/DUF377 family glycosyl hydrolase
MVKLKRHSSNPILAKNPKQHWEAGSVFNPCVIKDGDIFQMFYRATNDIKMKKKDGYISSIGYAESKDGVSWTRDAAPVLAPGEPYDADGCEDPRVTKIGDTYYMHYTAIAIENDDTWLVRIALATSKNGRTWTKHGVVGPAGSRSKAATLFPEPIGGKYWWFYTWEADRPESTIVGMAADNLEEVVSPPAGQVANTLENYDTWAVFAPPHTKTTLRGAEVGAPPIKTKDGWLFIYCNANLTEYPGWTVKAALLDLDDPRRVIAETPEPILAPETEEELGGVVENVTFPEGAVVVGDELYVYYGSGDQGCCLATCKLQKLLDYLAENKIMTP